LKKHVNLKVRLGSLTEQKITSLKGGFGGGGVSPSYKKKKKKLLNESKCKSRAKYFWLKNKNRKNKQNKFFCCLNVVWKKKNNSTNSTPPMWADILDVGGDKNQLNENRAWNVYLRSRVLCLQPNTTQLYVQNFCIKGKLYAYILLSKILMKATTAYNIFCSETALCCIGKSIPGSI